ncbi:MAG TPA: DUF305 domain-containing protein [Terriglobales bacterium]
MNMRALGFALSLILAFTVSMPARQDPAHRQADSGAAWLELGQSMEKMHDGMASIKPSGNSDVDFVRLMLPHHQAAIDMAKTELLYGKDPQMRRLAQEIITDQQSEIELMQLWLKQHESSPKR